MNSILDFIAENPMAALIVAGEVGFWVFILSGLVFRYLLRMRRTSTVLLYATPLIDLVILVAAIADLSDGGRAGWTHGLSAFYLGFSVAFGPRMVRWADVRFAHRFANGPKPVKPPKAGPERLRYEWREWYRCLSAAAISAAVLLVLIFVVGTPAQTTVLWSYDGWLPRLGLIAIGWFLLGPLWAMWDNPRGNETDSSETTAKEVRS